MEGVIVNFRRGRHVQYTNQMIIKVANIDTKEKTKSLIGKKVIWESPAKRIITGTIKKFHGNNGNLRAIFEKGMPGQAIGTKVKIE